MTIARDYVPEKRHARLTPGEALRIARELQGLSQSELARRTGIAQSALSALESGDTELGLKRVAVLAKALKVHPAVIAFPDWSAPVVDIHHALASRVRRRAAPTAARTRRTAR